MVRSGDGAGDDSTTTAVCWCGAIVGSSTGTWIEEPGEGALTGEDMVFWPPSLGDDEGGGGG